MMNVQMLLMSLSIVLLEICCYLYELLCLVVIMYLFLIIVMVKNEVLNVLKVLKDESLIELFIHIVII